ncbi:MAG: DUF1194 domain-containing protein [Rhodospirillales bacterium]|nr:DUF1194 domain-containing protein [Rhodospirillales bacterium]
MVRSPRRRRFIAGLGAGLAAAALPARAAEPVDLQLVLAADVSRSIDGGRFLLQRQGYATAIADPRVVRAMTGGRLHRVALSYCEWSGPGAQRTMVDWTLIDGPEAAEDFAARLLAPPRPFAGSTAIGEAVLYAMDELRRCPFPADRRTIDVSGDGTNTSGTPAAAARDVAVEAGVTINGLAILSDTPSPWNPQHTHPPGGLDEWYRANVIGGSGAFLLSVAGFDTFAYALVNKLSRETA